MPLDRFGRTSSGASILLAGVLLLACGDREATVERGTTPAPPSPIGSACDLIDPEAASTAAGVPMRVVSPPGATGCSLESSPAGLSIEYMALTRSAVFDEIAGHEAAERVGDVENAYFVPVEGSVLAQLHVATPTRMLVVTLRTAAEAHDLRAIAGRLAGAAAERL